MTSFFSLEMSKKQLLKRAACCIGKISSVKMRNPLRNFKEEDWNKFNVAMSVLFKLKMRIFDKAGMDIFYIWSKVRQLRKAVVVSFPSDLKPFINEEWPLVNILIALSLLMDFPFIVL